ncbi:hypothetical protein [Enterococcus hirae]|uniref:hypothetical protein n=1 Tax=Enterococcus hirae TaxID=1354 RepID=UPI002DC02DCB|nr:hypothetical protein [Enterococcus hirae]MEB5877626.1 hypothetical protein [Enterococcus hirae]MEB5904612.1 hypothetical protein [Enterococcus hirae]
MTTEGDVLKLKVPYPHIESGLVQKRHMYVFAERREMGKGLFVCTSKKPKHIRKGVPPLNRFEILPDEEIPRIKSPFRMPTLVDCDRLFFLNGISVPLTLLTNPRCICREYLENILQIRKNNKECEIIPLEVNSMISLNPSLNLKAQNTDLTLSS